MYNIAIEAVVRMVTVLTTADQQMRRTILSHLSVLARCSVSSGSDRVFAPTPMPMVEGRGREGGSERVAGVICTGKRVRYE